MRAMDSSAFFLACRNYAGVNAWLSHAKILIDDQPIPDDFDHLLFFNAFITNLPGKFKLRIHIKKQWIEAVGSGEQLLILRKSDLEQAFDEVVHEFHKLIYHAVNCDSVLYGLEPVEKIYHSLYMDLPAAMDLLKSTFPEHQPHIQTIIQDNYSLISFFDYTVQLKRDQMARIKQIPSETLHKLFVMNDFFMDLIDRFGEDIENLVLHHGSLIPIEHQFLALQRYTPVNDLCGRILAGEYVVNWVPTFENALYADNVQAKIMKS